MYSLNGKALNEGHSGWHILRDGTNTQGGITNSITKVGAPNRPGYTPAPTTYTEQLLIFKVRTPLARLEELLALCAAATSLTRTADSSKEAYVEPVSAIPTSDEPWDAWQDVTITLSVYQGVWRDVTTVVEGPTDITTPTQAFTGLFDDLSAPIFDADIFIRGVFGEFTLTDSGGSWLKTTRAWPGSGSSGLLFIGSTRQAFTAVESDPWTPVSDASQYIDESANGGFRLTPKLVSGNPADREVQLSLTTLTQTSTTLRVRAKRAYRMN